MVTECRCWWHFSMFSILLPSPSFFSIRHQHRCYRNVMDRDVKIASFQWNIMVTLNVHIEDPWRIQVARVHSQVFTENDDLPRSIGATQTCSERDTVIRLNLDLMSHRIFVADWTTGVHSNPICLLKWDYQPQKNFILIRISKKCPK